MSEPIKRNEALKPISRDHHHALLLGWKIRQGIKNKIPAERIKKYVIGFGQATFQIILSWKKKTCILY